MCRCRYVVIYSVCEVEKWVWVLQKMLMIARARPSRWWRGRDTNAKIRRQPRLVRIQRELSGATGQEMPGRSGQRLGRDRQRDLLGVLESEIIGSRWTAQPRAGRRGVSGTDHGDVLIARSSCTCHVSRGNTIFSAWNFSVYPQLFSILTRSCCRSS